MAVSTASEPPLVRNTRLPGTGARAASRCARASAGALVKRSKQWKVSSRLICAATASATSVRPCPTLQCHRLAMAST